MKVLIFPDIHGRSFWIEPLLKHKDDADAIVFLGDYFDPYPDEAINMDIAIGNFKEILKYTEDVREKTHFLLGNHDMHYVDDVFHEIALGTRYDKRYADEVKKQLSKINGEIAYFIKGENSHKDILFTHAGVSECWWNDRINIEEYPENIGEFLTNLYNSEDKEKLFTIGYRRGGLDIGGGPFWSDITEVIKLSSSTGKFESKLPFKDKLFQVCGHTQLVKYTEFDGNIAYLDIHKAFVLDTNTLKIEEA